MDGDGRTCTQFTSSPRGTPYFEAGALQEGPSVRAACVGYALVRWK